MNGEIDVVSNSIITAKINFSLNAHFWDVFDPKVYQVLHSLKQWSEVKLLNDYGEKNFQMGTLPNDKGGIYIFVAKPDIVPNTHLYLLYIGRARSTRDQNLRKRCSEYIYENKRPKIGRMIQQWGKYLYIRYLPLDDNELIDKIEAELINRILPPFNDAIPDKEIRAAVQAFSI